MSARRILGLKQVPRVASVRPLKRYVSWVLERRETVRVPYPPVGDRPNLGESLLHPQDATSRTSSAKPRRWESRGRSACLSPG